MVENKRAWIRILESVTALLIVLGVALVFYSGNLADSEEELQNYVFLFQKEVLRDISLRNDLREAIILEGSSSVFLQDYLEEKTPDFLISYIQVCDFQEDILTGELTSCPVPIALYEENPLKDIYVEETIISSTLNTYDPKRVQLYVLEK